MTVKDDVRPERRVSRVASVAAIWGLALVWLLVDILTKEWALEALAPGPREVVPGLLWLNLTRNAGAAFGLLPAGRPLFIAMALLLLGVGVWAPLALNIRRIGLGHAGLGLLVGGGLGNLVDRVFREGLVVDFIDFRVWPVFNVADMGIVTGTALVVLFLARNLFRSRADGS